ncbi:hypothetical protein HanHA300_Chr13g0478771 [Helianthus annuus]|nr:hypothetical protein HanHA300_Chr13g0478771 [Helianthus annuus]KAJ0663406.1 hypothetical protein HanLR1_Chr13g0480891 [Helianthus annuus]KAJ0848842.1 hypothetical protein HanPSC8_Chr13g0562181 [Helianthus annuus]
MCFDLGGSRLVEITSELVKRVFGLPMGPINLVEKKKANKKNDVVIQEFRNQFEHTDSKRLSSLQLMCYVLDMYDHGRLFVVNFLILYFSFLGETTTNNSGNVRYIPCIQPHVDIKSLNWCSYMVSCLNRTKKAWHGSQDAL